MKLVVMIPAFNEEKTIAKVIQEIPKKIAGITRIQVLVIDDGSTDKTQVIARQQGARIVHHTYRLGLARTFRDGLEKVLEWGADIIVNTDADFQYNQKQLPLLVKPLLEKKADLVLGSRFKGWIEDMPFQKRLGNQLATQAVSLVGGIPISDAQTGFRAFSKEAALRFNVLSNYTYTQETILQAAFHKLRIVEVPVDFRKRVDQSRLISNIFSYARHSLSTLVIGYLTYKPLRVFFSIGGMIFAVGLIAALWVLWHFFDTGLVSPHIPLAILSVALLVFGFQIIMIGLIAEMIKNNRILQEELLYQTKKKKFG